MCSLYALYGSKIKTVKKTNAIRLLDQRKIKYELVEYRYDPNNLDVQKLAKDNDLAVERVYKTLVAKGDKTGIVVAVIAGHTSLDFKDLAKASGNKKITLLPVKDLLANTGYIRGGCSPIGMKKAFPVFVDSCAETEEIIYINAGVRGVLIGVSPLDLQAVTNGVFVEIGRLRD